MSTLNRYHKIWFYFHSGRKLLNLRLESVLKEYLIVPAYLNFRNDLNVVLNFSVNIIRFTHQSLHTEIFSIQYAETLSPRKNHQQISFFENDSSSGARTQDYTIPMRPRYPLHHVALNKTPIPKE